MVAEPAILVERENIRFSLQKIRDGLHVFNAQRISDEHHLAGQLLFSEDPSEFLDEIIARWYEENPGLNDAPAPTFCYACGKELEADHDTDYQFDNALWIGFHGGYGMFTDLCDFPPYEHERKLPGRPDEEAVICHECAHALCDAVPWIAKLIEPHRSHAHHTNHIPELLERGHQGWDLDRHYAEMEAAYDQQDKENG